MDQVLAAESSHSEMIVTKAQRLAVVSRWGKGIQCIVAAVAAIAQFGPMGWTHWPALGVGSTFVFLLLAVAMLVFEPDASSEIAQAQKHLNLARQKLDAVNQLQSQLEEAAAAFGQQLQLVESIKLFRNVLETAAAQRVVDEVAICRLMLDVGGNSLARASGFETHYDWTITVYRATSEGGGKLHLRPIAQERAVKCKLDEARSWPAGVGTSGRCLAERREIANRNIWDGETLGEETGGVAVGRPNDRERYKSMFATPIMIQPNAADPWGVVCASTNTVGHFHRDSDNTNQWAEPTRFLAKMFELGILVADLNKAANQPLVGGA